MKTSMTITSSVTTVVLVLAALLVATSCASDSSDSGDTPPSSNTDPTEMPHTDLDALDIPNMTTPMDGLLCAGQLSPEQMDGLYTAGFKNFVSLRVASENGAGWEEEHADGKEYTFVRMPIAGKDDIDTEHAKALRAKLDELKGPTVLYCGSSNRVGALLAVAAHEVDGRSAEEALEFGRSAGLTKLEPVAAEAMGR